MSEETKRLLTEGKCLCLRLKVMDKSPEADIDNLLFNILFGEPRVPEIPDALVEGCFVQRNLPPLREFIKDTMSIASSPEKLLCLTTVWVPLNSRNKAMAFRVIFAKYVENTYPVITARALIYLEHRSMCGYNIVQTFFSTRIRTATFLQ